MNKINKLLCVVMINQFLSLSVCLAQDSVKADLNIQDIALPSEVKDIGKQPGTIYYDTSSKNKALVPTHIWGEVQRPGLHFIPTDTSMIKGLSMAGGPTGAANLGEVLLTRMGKAGDVQQYEFDLANGGDSKVHNFKIESGDTIYIKKDTFYENRSYYTSWVSIGLSLITTFFIINKVQ